MRRLLVPWIVVCALATSAGAAGIGIPSSRWGLGFGNTPEFTGLRLNFRDRRVKRVTGINLTLWQPHRDNADAVITGLSFGLIPGGGTMRGLQVGVFGIVGVKSVVGISLATLGMGTGEDMAGINVAGLGLGAGRDLLGINVAGLGLGAGADIVGLSVGGLGAGAGGSMIGINVAGLGMGAGRELAGLNLAGLGLGAGVALKGVSIAGLAAGAPSVKGLTIAGGVVGGQRLVGVHIAGGSVHAIDNGEMVGLAISAFNYIRGTQTGISIGLVNYAWRVRGLQLGVVNIVRDNPTPLKVLPVLNSSF